MKYPLDFSTIIIITLVAFTRSSCGGKSSFGIKFKKTGQVEKVKIRELIEITKSDAENSDITKKLFGDIKAEIIFVEPTVCEIIRKGEKFMSNEIVLDLIDLAIAVADLNPAIEISIDVIKLTILVIRQLKVLIRDGKLPSNSEEMANLGENLYKIAKSSVTNFPKKVEESFEKHQNEISKIVRISKSEGNGAIAKGLLRHCAVVWVKPEVEKVIRLADKLLSDQTADNVEQLTLAVAELNGANEIAVDSVQVALAVLKSIERANQSGKKFDLKELEEKIKNIGLLEARVYAAGSHPLKERKLKKKKSGDLVDIAESTNNGPICEILLNKMKAKVISVEPAVHKIIINTERFLENPIVENLFELALDIAEINPYVEISVASFKLVVAIIKKIKKEIDERGSPDLNEELERLKEKVSETLRHHATVKISHDDNSSRRGKVTVDDSTISPPTLSPKSKVTGYIKKVFRSNQKNE